MDSPRFSGNPALLQHFVFRGLIDLGADDGSTAGHFPARLVVVLVDVLGLVERGERLDLGRAPRALLSPRIQREVFLMSIGCVRIVCVLYVHIVKT
jgi:hypothetical protein